mgnify:CR=1 FL=1
MGRHADAAGDAHLDITVAQSNLAHALKQARGRDPLACTIGLGQEGEHRPRGVERDRIHGAQLPAVQQAAARTVDEARLRLLLATEDAVVVLEFEDPAGGSEKVLRENPLFERAEPVADGRLISLAVDESNAAYFDSVLTVRRNLELIERVGLGLGRLGVLPQLQIGLSQGEVRHGRVGELGRVRQLGRMGDRGRIRRVRAATQDPPQEAHEAAPPPRTNASFELSGDQEGR